MKGGRGGSRSSTARQKISAVHYEALARAVWIQMSGFSLARKRGRFHSRRIKFRLAKGEHFPCASTSTKFFVDFC